MKRLVSAALAVVFALPAHAHIRAATLLPQNEAVLGDIAYADLDPVAEDLYRQAQTGDMLLHINSNGGSVFAGLEFIRYVEQLKKTYGRRLTCCVDVFAASMAFVILQGACDVRQMTKRSVLLAHRSSTRAEGNAEDLETAAMFLKAIDAALFEIEMSRATIKRAEYARLLARGDVVMSWELAKRWGFIDEAVP